MSDELKMTEERVILRGGRLERSLRLAGPTEAGAELNPTLPLVP